MTDRTAWLIEAGDHKYWDGRKTHSGRPSLTSNHAEAVRFARAEDANRVIFWLLEEYAPLLVAREHAWMEPLR